MKRVFSGIQATGIPTLGNYLGAMKHWAAGQDDPDTAALYCVVDLHAVTVRQPPEKLYAQSLEVFASLLAAGLDPQKTTVYLQSHVHEHAELSWLLGCFTMMGELNRMTQFKDKSLKNADNLNAGLYTYPVLMAADILLFDADEVPVGEDQKQHVELCRNIAQRFNGVYGDVFVMPEPVIPKLGARIMSLTEPTAKMSKSDLKNPGSVILLTDSDDTVLKKFKRAVTDTDESENRVRYDPVHKPGVSNLLTIYATCRGKPMPEAESDFAGMGYGPLKTAVAEAVIDTIRPIRAEIGRLLSDPAELQRVMTDGKRRATAIAEPVLKRVRQAMGFVPKTKGARP
jgi:tryptophanyl-tRNA synthetase